MRHLKKFEDINIPIKVGDTVLGGRFKNKKIVVKKIGKNDKGDITINGKPLLKFRIIKESKNNPTQDYFNDKINWDLINTLKDLSQDCLDEGGKLLYSAEVANYERGQPHRLLMGSFFTREEDFDPSIEVGDFERELSIKYRDMIPKDNITFVNLYDEYLQKAIKSWEKHKEIIYGFCLYESGYYNQHRERDDESSKEVLKRIKSMFPNENIHLVR